MPDETTGGKRLPKLELVYDSDEGGYAFADVEAYAEVQRQQEIIDTSRTWGEFRRRADDTLLYFAALTFEDDIEQVPWEDDERFDPWKHLPGYDEGLVPEWTFGEMAHLIPRDLLDAYCEQETSPMSGDSARVRENNIWPLAQALRARGYEVDLGGFDRRHVVGDEGEEFTSG